MAETGNDTQEESTAYSQISPALPALPKPDFAAPTLYEYTAEQMRAYGEACRAEERDLRGQLQAECANMATRLMHAEACRASGVPADLPGLVWRACVRASLDWQARDRVVSAFTALLAAPPSPPAPSAVEARKPLTEEQIENLTAHMYATGRAVPRSYRIEMARAIERAHGIV